MNVITDTLRQLVRRKLWPVALVLLGALVAVPLLLAKQPESDAIAQAANAKKVEPLPATFVSAGGTETAETTDKRRRVLGAEKDPFEPAELPKVKQQKASKAQATPTATPADDSSSKSDGSGGGGATTPPVSTAPTPTPAPTVTVPAYSVKVRFGTTETDELPETTIERLSVLPDEQNPVIVYRGVVDGGKAAIFELTGDVEAEGDATCSPRPEDCQYIKLRAGETEFLTVSDTVTETGEAATAVQYQLDLVKVYKKKTKEKVTDPNAATSQSLAKASSSSFKSKRVPLRRRNRYVFDAPSGLLHLAAKGAKTPRSSL
jgi:hypothetical protein